jgi:hypothetical protein
MGPTPPTAPADARSGKEAQPAAPGARINKKADSRKYVNRPENKQQTSLLPSAGRIVWDYSEYRQRIDEARRAATALNTKSSDKEPTGKQAPIARAQARFALNNVGWGVAGFDPEEILLLVNGFELRKNAQEADAERKKGAQAQAQSSKALYWGVRRGEHWRIWHPYGNNSPSLLLPFLFFQKNKSKIPCYRSEH